MKIMLTLLMSSCLFNYGYSQENKSDTTKIKPLVIKSNTTTDPNYSKNKIKSDQTNQQLSSEPKEIVKDDVYYNTNIQLLKNRIKEIEESPNNEGVNPDKLEKLKIELKNLEVEYSNYLKK